MFSNMEQLLRLAAEKKTALWQIILENEMQLTAKTKNQIFENLNSCFQVMTESANKALSEPQETVGNLITGTAFRQEAYSHADDSLCGPFINRVMALALSCSEVNAAMGKICAAPTAGSCGILPAVLIGVQERYGLTRRQVLQGLMTASGIGSIIMKNATVAGAEGGCQAECGVAAAIAAAAAVEMRGGSPQTAANACSIALVNIMGLVCDPVAGLVQ
ncbi:MAG: L-serine ammonia-lyase, iron-sulfur-dependent, subunit alpha, partial [Acetanaerobacterium sp.]